MGTLDQASRNENGAAVSSAISAVESEELRKGGVEKPRRFFNEFGAPVPGARVEKPRGFFNREAAKKWAESSPRQSPKKLSCSSRRMAATQRVGVGISENHLRGRRRLRVGLAAEHGVVDFLPMDGHGYGSFDSQSYFVPTDFHHRDHDVFANDNLLVMFP